MNSKIVKPTLDRRRFLQLGAAGAGSFVLGAFDPLAIAQSQRPQVLVGPEFDLTVDALPVNYTGKRRVATAINGQVPAPLLRIKQGETVTIRIHNRLSERSSIHWHGLIVPADMDGVPGLSFDGIAPRSTFTYRFKVNQSGTYWYHSHSRFQEQLGLYGPIVVEPRDGERHRVDREYTLLLSDWTDIDPERIYRLLKVQSDYFNHGQETVGDFVRDAKRSSIAQARNERQMWNQMRMRRTDLLDVSGHAYTYLMNGATPAGNWTGVFKRGEKVRLRIINGSSMSVFDVRIPDLKLTVVAADGQDIEPVTVDEMRMAAAEVYDVIVEPKDDRAYTIFAQAMDRSGYARGTLTPDPKLTASIPPLDARPLLAMSDMGMSHGDHGTAQPEVDHSKMDHSQHGGAPMKGENGHPASESSPLVDMQAMQPSARLDDPGVGLRDNGRRVLTYADLKTIGGPIDSRTPGREIELHLTGHMERFAWSFNGQKFSEAAPLQFHHGERLRITLVNDTMMTHPIHLHGMWSEVENERQAFQVRKHTVMVHPAQKLSYAVTADALGRWAFHCHLIYHMEAGMFREVVVAHTGDHS